MSDPLELVRELAPTVERQPELIERVRNDLMTTINESSLGHDPAPVPGSRRARRRWLIPATAALVMTTAAAGWAITRTSSDSTALECPGNSIIDATTGDPVTDCGNEWRRSRDIEPPAMVAYDNGNGGVTVLLATDDAPASYTALEPGTFQNTGLIQLGETLGDAGSGLGSACYGEDAAREITRTALDRLGFTNWTITVDNDRRPGGESRCAYFIVNPTTQQVQLIGIEGTTSSPNPYRPYATALADQLAATCMSLDNAGSLARSLASETAIVIDGTTIDLTEQAQTLVINEVEDPAADCTRSVVNVEGRIEVTLRGPTG